MTAKKKPAKAKKSEQTMMKKADPKPTSAKTRRVAPPAAPTEAKTSTSFPDPPAGPAKKDGARREKRRGPQADLQRAKLALANLVATYKDQYARSQKPWAHSTTGRVDFRPLYERMVGLKNILHEKGLLREKLDLSYDWAGFPELCRALEEDILVEAFDTIMAKADRMVWTGDLKYNDESDKAIVTELWDKINDQGHARGRIWAAGNLVTELEGFSCTDPEEEIRGSRQHGGNRRH